jgi:hypothetical protein
MGTLNGLSVSYKDAMNGHVTTPTHLLFLPKPVKSVLVGGPTYLLYVSSEFHQIWQLLGSHLEQDSSYTINHYYFNLTIIEKENIKKNIIIK